MRGLVAMTKKEWLAKGLSLYGENGLHWRFKCPACGFIASAQDYKDAGAPSHALPFHCIGRWKTVRKEAFDDKDKRNIPCNYSSGGLLNINPVDVDGVKVFDFAD